MFVVCSEIVVVGFYKHMLLQSEHTEARLTSHTHQREREKERPVAGCITQPLETDSVARHTEIVLEEGDAPAIKVMHTKIFKIVTADAAAAAVVVVVVC